MDPTLVCVCSLFHGVTWTIMPKYGHLWRQSVTWPKYSILIGRENFCCALIGRDPKGPYPLLLRSKMASSSSTSTSITSSAVPRALISRERVPKSNTGNYKERGNSDPKNMSPRDRIEEFPGENLCLRGGKLFCNGCKEILSSKKSILKNHLASKKHAAGKEKLKVNCGL